MTLLDRYIGWALIRAFFLVALILLSLFLLLDLVQQLEDVGSGNYGLADALLFELLMVPGYLVDLMPFTALLGTSIALGALAHGGELTAMRASGFSTFRIGLAALKTGFLVMLAVALTMELITPGLQQYAVKRQSEAISGAELLVQTHGFWIKQNNRFINVRDIYDGHIPANVHIFEFDQNTRRLTLFLHADHADTSKSNQWIFQDLILKKFSPDSVVTRREAQLAWQPYLTKRQLQVLELPIDSLSPLDLYQYLRYLQASGQGTERFELVYWQKVSHPLAIGAMIVLAFPFVFGSLRSASAGKRIVLSTIAGITFELARQLLANLGLMLDLSPIITTLGPITIALMLSLLLLRRVR